VRHFSAVNRSLLLEAGTSLHLSKATATRLLDHLLGRALPQAQALYADVEAENVQLVRARPELSATLAGESRCLRAIVYTVLNDMTRQLAGAAPKQTRRAAP